MLGGCHPSAVHLSKTAKPPAAPTAAAEPERDSPLLEEGEAHADGHVVDAQRDGVPLFWSVLSESKSHEATKEPSCTSNIKTKNEIP